MGSEPVVFRYSARRGWGLVQFGITPIILGGVFTYISSIAMGGRERGYNLWPLVIFGGFGLLLVALGLSRVVDRAPKLTVGESGITDHGCAGGRHLTWDVIQGVDWRTTGKDNLGGELILYVRASDGEVTPHRVDITELDGGPVRVGTEVKANWLRFSPSASGGGRTDPHAAPDAGR